MDHVPLPVDAIDPISQEERAVLQAIRDTSYGAVEVVLHQQRIVQIVRTQKLRLESQPAWT